MALKMCPGCRQNVADNARRCPACGWELSTFNDLSANRTITIFARLALLISVVAVALVDFKYNVSFMPQIHDLGAIFLIACISSYLLMKIATFRARRKVWLAAIGSGMLAASGLYVARVLMQQGELPMLALALSARSDATTQPVMIIPAATQPATYSSVDYEPLTALAGKALATIRRQPLVLRAELNAAGVPRMLENSTLSDARRISAARARIKRLYERLEAYESAIRKAPADTYAQSKDVDVSEGARSRFFAAFRPIADQAIRNSLGFVEFERKSLGEVDALLQLAQSKAGKFTVRGQTISFADQSDEARYTALRRTIAESAAHEQQLLRGFQTTSDPFQRALVIALEAPDPAPPSARRPEPRTAPGNRPSARSAEASVAQ